jgi:hypothetical protein
MTPVQPLDGLPHEATVANLSHLVEAIEQEHEVLASQEAAHKATANVEIVGADAPPDDVLEIDRHSIRGPPRVAQRHVDMHAPCGQGRP